MRVSVCERERERESESVCVCLDERKREIESAERSWLYFLSTAILHVISVMPEIIDNNNEKCYSESNINEYNNTVLNDND